MNESKLKTLFFVLLGNTIYALGVTCFILPSGMITGGTAGLALSFNHFFNIPIPIFVLCFNVLTFVLGAVILGKKFAMTTIVSTFYFPIILEVFSKFPALSNVTDDRMLCTICGGICVGLSIGIVIRVGASTGGVDIPPLILNKKFGIPVSFSLYAIDCTILLLQMLFSNAESAIYGILLVMIYSVILDKFLLMGTSQTEVKIISREYERINIAIQTNLDRGTTFLEGKTGYLGIEQPIILSVVSNRELTKLNNIVMDIDPHAFMIIGNANEVKGYGFSGKKKYIKKSEFLNSEIAQ